MTIKASGKGHLITFGKYEWALTPLGNIPADQVTGFVNTLRNALRAYVNK